MEGGAGFGADKEVLWILQLLYAVGLPDLSNANPHGTDIKIVLTITAQKINAL
jgi:hypothetical protein